MAKAIVEATTHFRDPEILARVSAGLGEAMRGLANLGDGARGAAADPRLVSLRAANIHA